MTNASHSAVKDRDGLAVPARRSDRRLLERFWDHLPAGARTALQRTGLPYTTSYLWNYRSRHAVGRFAGELPGIREQYEQAATPAQRAALIARFDAVLDSLVLCNGVRKTSYAARQAKAISTFLGREQSQIPSTPLRVLDLPCSSGVAALDTFTQLQAVRDVQQYVLSDLNFEVYLDEASGCIYDETGHLLQVRGKKRFVSIYRPHVGGDVHSFLAKVLLWPLSLRSRFLRSKYSRLPGPDLLPISLLHPEVQAKLAQGLFKVERMDVFNITATDCFDIIISFNLLQRNYFSPETISRGVSNLCGALRDGGYLIMGNSESFGIQRRRGSELVTVYQEGKW